ncbi:putative uncharacterized protein [Methylocaldum marinum]|uniref:Uncharacterized protein n=1 Tax=Methylocaldum marinum TaxID=1432792 RepID=A0A250KLV2_9GAMM|nr:DUF3613 domain-containing protein [Methylocaldum marinum]BBA32526.1 putative uncharacterized protein [Methylocaldum marinum]
MRCILFAFPVLAALRATSAVADSAPVEIYPLETPSAEPSAARTIAAETETGLWLGLQSSGTIAGRRYILPGKEATQIYQRYLKSFEHPIPEQFNFKRSTSSRSSR